MGRTEEGIPWETHVKGTSCPTNGNQEGVCLTRSADPDSRLAQGAGVHLTLLSIAVLGQGFWAKEFQSPNPQRP